MSANRLLDWDSVFNHLVSEIFHLRYAAFQIGEFRGFIQPNRQCGHVSSRHAAIGDETFIDDGEIGCGAVDFFIV
ncbi:hypothetical protein SDC9_169215 [bioreactor metagenome]|uniref:Uncharacterized protein n=1 Tax=bioreactor metagenome TaxID=1076179 RepID=A0A645GDC4_9ZZZZ